MSQPPSPHDSGLNLRDALPYFLAIIAAAGSWFAARSTAFAQLSKTVLDASRRLVEQTQTLHAQDGALISKQAARINELELEVLRKDGEIRLHLQQVDSFRRAWEREKVRNKECRCPKVKPPSSYRRGSKGSGV